MAVETICITPTVTLSNRRPWFPIQSLLYGICRQSVTAMIVTIMSHDVKCDTKIPAVECLSQSVSQWNA